MVSPEPCHDLSASPPRVTWAAVLFFVLALLVVLSIRVRLLGVPLERDEGEYAYMAQLLLQGVPPYEQAYSMKLPGTYFVYAVALALGGQTVEAIHLGLLLANASSTLLFFALVRYTHDQLTAALAAAAFAFLSLAPQLVGTTAQVEQFALPPLLAGWWLLLRGLDKDRRGPLIASGLLMGLALLFKQHVALLILPGVLLLMVRAGRRRHPLNVLLASLSYLVTLGLPLVFLCAWLAWQGVFDRFWFWTVVYAREYIAYATWSEGLDRLAFALPRVASASPALWCLAALGLASLAWSPAQRQSCRVWCLLLLFGLAAVCPGLHFRQHYFLLLLPAVSLFAAVAMTEIGRGYASSHTAPQATWVALLIAAGVLGATLWSQRAPWLQLDTNGVSRATYGGNPFPEAVVVGDYLRQHTADGDTIFVFGSEPQIYFYAQRRAATPYIYTYPLVERQPFAPQMQKELIEQVEAARPRFIVAVNASSSWARHPEAPAHLFEWFEEYRDRYYERCGIIEVQSLRHTEYRWGARAAAYRPHSPVSLVVLQRKPERRPGRLALANPVAPTAVTTRGP